MRGVALSELEKVQKCPNTDFLLGLKCPKSDVDGSLQNQQIYCILPHFQSQIELLRIIPIFNLGIHASFLNFCLKTTSQIQNCDICACVLNQNVPNSEEMSSSMQLFPICAICKIFVLIYSCFRAFRSV
jgi:hypothetical protein